MFFKFNKKNFRLSDGVIGNTSDFGSEDSRFKSWSDNRTKLKFFIYILKNKNEYIKKSIIFYIICNIIFNWWIINFFNNKFFY